jgi:hypothetical protein
MATPVFCQMTSPGSVLPTPPPKTTVSRGTLTTVVPATEQTHSVNAISTSPSQPAPTPVQVAPPTIPAPNLTVQVPAAAAPKTSVWDKVSAPAPLTAPAPAPNTWGSQTPASSTWQKPETAPLWDAKDSGATWE